MFTVPLVVTVAALVTVPADTVAKVGSLVFQVATSVNGKDPLHVCAVAVKSSVRLLPVKAAGLVGVTWIDWMHPTVTVTVCCPLIVGF